MISKLIGMFKKDPIKAAEKQLASLDKVLDTLEAGIYGSTTAVEEKNSQIAKLEAEASVLLDRQLKLVKTFTNLERVLG